MDAIVSERLTFSDRIVDLYGHCGVSILSEFFPGGDFENLAIAGTGYAKQVDLDKLSDVRPQNNFTTLQKLQIAHEMAEAVAEIHNFEEGRIVHDDIQPAQFLYGSGGFIKLNDFNRGEPMLWDEERQEWCRYRNGAGQGSVSSLLCLCVMTLLLYFC